MFCFLDFPLHFISSNSPTPTLFLSCSHNTYTQTYIHTQQAWVITSGILLSICVIVFVFLRSYAAVICMSLLIGVGLGIFLAVDFAMVMDVLPGEKENAKVLILGRGKERERESVFV